MVSHNGGARTQFEGQRGTTSSGADADLRRASEPWRADSYALNGKVELIPVRFLMFFRGNALGKTDLDTLTEDMRANGVREPLILTVGQRDRKVKLGEGNHRVEAAIRLDATHLPVRVLRMQFIAEGGVVFDRMARVPVDSYFPADAPPSAVFDEGAIEWLTAQKLPRRYDLGSRQVSPAVLGILI